MKKIIVHVAPELTPFAKTGGLADMVSALAAQQKKEHNDVYLIIPFYRSAKDGDYYFSTKFSSMCVKMGIEELWCSVHKNVTKDNITIYLIEYNEYFDRSGIYHDDKYNDYADNLKRFAFLSRAALQLIIDAEIKPDVIHVHDWQTALVSAYLKTWFWNHPILGKCPSILTIHNASYQGIYPANYYAWLGLPKGHFTPNIFEDFGRINLLKGGIYYADAINTVSPTHANEISTPYGGFGLAPYIANKRDAFCGILNGVNYKDWSPENDTFIPQNFSIDSMKGKAACKIKLQQKLSLNEDPNIALIGSVGRLVAQKGHCLVKKIIENVVQNMHVQFVIVGSGDSELEKYFIELSIRYPDKVGCHIGFSNKLAHLIEAGCDFFLMPSLYEPCGLNQMYSMKYGTIPIVRLTGGLADTVENYDEISGKGTGFVFKDISPHALYYTIGWAISTYYDRPEHMKKLVLNAMKQDFSWKQSSAKYLSLYNLAFQKKEAYDRSFIQ